MRVRAPRRMHRDSPACRLHAWSCPVIMKTDPDHAAWTCARCGALAVTPVGERPQAGSRQRSTAAEAA